MPTVLDVDGFQVRILPIRAIPALRAATEAQLSRVEIDPSGGALRWADLDVDVGSRPRGGRGEIRRHVGDHRRRPAPLTVLVSGIHRAYIGRCLNRLHH